MTEQLEKHYDESSIVKASIKFLDALDETARTMKVNADEVLGAAILAVGGLCVGTAMTNPAQPGRYDSNEARYSYAAAMGQALAAAVMHHFAQLPTDKDAKH